ncbi:MAG TPA: hypothetical protein VF486_11645, partial [Actinomycetes bacterium]
MPRTEFHRGLPLRSSSPRTPRISRRQAIALGIGVAGLAFGIGVAALANRQPAAPRPTASVQHLDLSYHPEGTQAPAAAPARPVAAGSAAEAVQRFLRANAKQDFATSFALLDQASRKDYRTVAGWTAAQADRPPVTGVAVGGARRAGGGAVEVTANVTHPAAVDPFAGLTPGRTVEVWRAHREGGRWRVAADPVSARTLLPADAAAPAAVQSWVDRLARCDAGGAAGMQAAAELYGPADLAAAPCQQHGAWKAAA